MEPTACYSASATMLCYAMLLNEVMKYLQPEQFYNAWPDVRRVRGTEWKEVVSPLLNIIFSKECVWTSTTLEWIKYGHATFIPKSTTLEDVVKRVLIACSVKLVEIPDRVWNALDYQNRTVTLVSPTIARREMKVNATAYTHESYDSKIELLTYCLLDQKYSDLLGLQLLPLADMTFIAFQKARINRNIAYLCSPEFPRDLLPNVNHLLVDVSDKALQSKLRKVANSGKTQLKVLNVQTIATLLPQCQPSEWKHSQTVSLPSSSFPSDWFEKFWKWVRPYDLSYFANQLVVPIAVTDTQYGFKVSKLSPSSRSSIVYISASDDYSQDLLSVLDKLQAQCTIYSHVSYLSHSQLYSYLNKFNPSGMLTAIANAGNYSVDSFSTSEASRLQRFLSSTMPDSLHSAQQQVLNNLQMFTCLNKEGLFSAVQASKASWGNKAILEPPGMTVDQDSLPSNLTILSQTNHKNLLNYCSSLVTMPRTILNFVLDTVFPMIRSGAFPQAQLDLFMEQVLQVFPVLKQQSYSLSRSYQNSTSRFVMELSSLPFLKTSSWSSRSAPQALFDPLNTEMRNLYKGESVFPTEPFNQLMYVSYLRECGLRISVTGQELLTILNSVCPSASIVPQNVNAVQMTRIKAVLTYISSHSTLNERVILGRYSQTLGQAFQTLSQQKCFLPVVANPPKNYPKCLPWKGSGYTSHVGSENSTVLLQKSDSIPLIAGSEMYVVTISADVMNLLITEVPINHVLSHFKRIVQQHKNIECATLDVLVHHMYTFLKSNIQRLANTRPLALDLRSPDCQWVWLKNQHEFVCSRVVVVQNHASFAYSLEPYFHQLPRDLHKYSRLLTYFGVHQQLTNSQIVSVLKKVKEDNSNTVPTQQVWKMVEHILNWLTDGGDSLASMKLKPDDIVYVPIESPSERPRLIEAEKVVYVDLDFLKGFRLTSKDSVTYIHHRVAHLAKSLGEKPLSSHLNIAEDAFGDVGQHEPLVTRLKNILRDYKDGLTIIKELLQNADDAEATELNICYDARTHTTDPNKLLFSGMSKCHGPALLVHNNAVFTKEDFENITKLAGATKQNKPLKIGKFGVGFCSVYHITDVPSFVSDDWLYIFDPTIGYLQKEIQNPSRPGKKLRFTEPLVKHSSQLEPYLNMFNFQQDKPYQGTLFRFPFRTSASDISGLRYNYRHVNQLVSDIKKAGSKLLLFLKNINRITVSHIPTGESKPIMLLDIRKSDVSTVISENAFSNDSTCAMIKQVSTRLFSNQQLTKSCQIESWLVSSHSTLLSTDKGSQLAVSSVACSLKESSSVDVIDSASYDPETVNGEVFCFLPLSLQTGIPVHISSNFAVLNDRTGIHSSDGNYRPSEEVKWNLQLMMQVIPKAYLTLLLALQNMCRQGSVSVEEYSFYLLWPLKESLVTHRPWDDFLPILYQHIANNKLLYSTCTEQWISLKETKILSTYILCYSGSKELSTPQCVKDVLEHLLYPLVYFPLSVKTQFLSSEITKCMLNEEEFLAIFFQNIENISIDTRNDVLFALLEAYSVTQKSHMVKYIQTNSCVPCVPNGVQLKKCSEIVDPCNRFSKLFETEEGRFPVDRFHTNDLIHTTLVKFGMISDTLPWDMLIDRASTVADIHARDLSSAMKRVALIVMCIHNKLQQFQNSSFSSTGELSYNIISQTPSLPVEATQLRSIAFLPVREKPVNYPEKLTWSGKSHKLLKSTALTKHYRSISLLGSQVPIVRQSFPGDIKHLEISDEVCAALGISTEPKVLDVINHLCHIADAYRLTAPDEKDREWIEKACEAIYDFFEQQLSQQKISHDSLSKLTTIYSIWTGKEFIHPSSIACNWTHDGPHLYGLPHLLKTKTKFIKAIGIQERFTIDQLLDTLKEVHDGFHGQPLSENEVKIIPDVASEIESLLGDSELTENQTVYLPNEKCLMYETKDLAFNDAPWCVMEQEEWQFVHPKIIRQTAEKLGVKLVRAKALEYYESPEHHFDGVPFGQHEDLTQRIMDILGEYPCDVTVIKELLQNADDAKATKMYVILDKRSHGTEKLLSSQWEDLQGPALLVWNDKGFEKKDFKGIQKLGLGSKRSNWESIGQYGIGFNVVYHLTDCPSFFTNGNALCVLDPHCWYVPGANEEKPGRQYNNLDEQFWSNYSDLKTAYLQDKIKDCPSEVKNSGTLFRFPLRHTKELVDQSKLINKEHANFGISNIPLLPLKLEEYLNEWAPKLKRALTFLNHVTELKFFVIDPEHQPESLVPTHHYRVDLDQSALNNRKLLQEKTALFKGENPQPFVVTYPLTLREVVPGKENECYLIQQGVGDIQNTDQYWQFLKQVKPKHGIAARIDGYNLTGSVFCFLPLPIHSRLPVHVNGNFILDAARSGLWQPRDSEADDRKRWNIKLIEAIASSYVKFLLGCRDRFVSTQPYANKDNMWSAVRQYYNIFPNWEGANPPEAEMKMLAELVYKGLHEQNCKVLVAFSKIPRKSSKALDTDMPKGKQKVETSLFQRNPASSKNSASVLAYNSDPKIHHQEFSYKTEWLCLLSEKNPAKQAHFWEKASSNSKISSISEGIPHKAADTFSPKSLDLGVPKIKSAVVSSLPKPSSTSFIKRKHLEAIPSILKSIGMNLTAAPMKIKKHFEKVEVKLPQALPSSVYKYYSTFFEQISPNGMFPCQLKDTPFGSVKRFLIFTEYIMEETTLDDEPGRHYKFPDPGPFGVPLLLTADGRLCMFMENSKVIISKFSNLFEHSRHKFLHPDMLGIKYVKSYFMEPSEVNWYLIKEILEKTLPHSLHNEMRLHHADKLIDVQYLLKPFWVCLLLEKMFKIHIENILKEWALMLTNKNQIFACSKKLLPAIAPPKITQKSTPEAYSVPELQALNEEEVYKIMENCGMPILNASVCYASLCSAFCPQFCQPERILENLYFLFQSGELTMDERFKNKLDVLFTYFGRIHFAQDANSLYMIKSVPIFKDIDGKYCALSHENYILPSEVCLAGKEIWLKDTGSVILSRDGKWRNLRQASDLGIEDISPLATYTKFIFPSFHLLSDKERLEQLTYIRDKPELFDFPFERSQTNKKSKSVEVKESKQYIFALQQLSCIRKEGVLRPIRDFCDPTQSIFKTFPENFIFLPSDFIDEDGEDMWLDFLLKMGLRSSITQGEFTQFCHSVSRGQHNQLQLASDVLMQYLFEHKDWHEDQHFLTSVTDIPFVCTEPLETLSWIYPVCKGNTDTGLTKLKGAVNEEYCKLVWTVNPVIKLPESSLYSSKEEKKFHERLGLCTTPSPSQVVKNILNISKSRFADFRLFQIYPQDCIPDPKVMSEDFLLEVLEDNFSHLWYDNQCTKSELNQLENAPCVPVSNTGETEDITCAVLVRPIVVIASSSSELAKLQPFINLLPSSLYSYLPGLLSEIGVKSEVQLCHVIYALKAIYNQTEPQFDPNTRETVKYLIKKLYYLIKNETSDAQIDELLYLPSETKLMPSNYLLFDDTGLYKNADFDFSQVEYSMVSLLTNKYEELNEYQFQLNDFCAVLPQNVRPLPLSTCCINKLHESCKPLEIHSPFAENLQLSLKRTNFGECAQMILRHTSTNHEVIAKFSESLEDFSKSVEVITVPDLKVDVYLNVVTPCRKIGTAKVHFSLQKDQSGGYVLYVNENATPLFYNLFETLTSTITECVANMAGIDKAKLSHPEKAIQILLQASSAEEVKHILNDLGINIVQLKITDAVSVVNDLTPKLGAKIPEQWIHRLETNINHVFRPQEWVGYEVRDNYFIFAQILYKKRSTAVATIALEKDEEFNLPLYAIRIREDDDDEEIVSIIDLYKILSIRQVMRDDGSTELVLYDSESESVRHWDEVKDDKLKDIMKEICSELRRIQKIRDPDQRRKAKKAMYLKWHPDKNNSHFAKDAFPFLQRQIKRLEQGLDLEDPEEEWEKAPEPPSSRTCDKWFESWDNAATKRNSAWQREQSDIERAEEEESSSSARSGNLFGGAMAMGGGFGGGGLGRIGGMWSGWEWENSIQVIPEPDTAKVWIKQAEWDLAALNLLLTHPNNTEKVSAQVCFHAHQVAEKSLKAGMYAKFGLHHSSLVTHKLTGHAGALEGPHTTGLYSLAAKLDNYYLRTRYPNVHSPILVPSEKFTSGEAKGAKEVAGEIFEMMKAIVM